jgi:hypothetical protein
MRLRRIVPLAVAAVVVSTVAASQGQAGGGVAIASCGTTVTTNAYLINDILDCPDHGVTVGADGITIDLKGFTIGGTQAGLRYGINNTGGHDGLTVKNGVVTKFDYGVAASGDGVTVSRLVASGNVNAGIWIDGSSASVKSSSALGNGASGIIVQGGNGANIQSSTASGNALDGIFTNNGSVSVTKSIAFGTGPPVSKCAATRRRSRPRQPPRTKAKASTSRVTRPRSKAIEQRETASQGVLPTAADSASRR